MLVKSLDIRGIFDMMKETNIIANIHGFIC